MAHRLHIRVLNGNEEAMGPMWFFEGFALLAAGQFENASLKTPKIWEVVEDPQRGSYKHYSAVIRHFLKKVSLQDMIEQAGKPEFNAWRRREGPQD